MNNEMKEGLKMNTNCTKWKRVLVLLISFCLLSHAFFLTAFSEQQDCKEFNPETNVAFTQGGIVFSIAPYRLLTEKDLREVKPMMPTPMYLKAVGAHEFPAYRDGDIAAYGLEKECKEESV